jgi:alanine racemase
VATLAPVSLPFADYCGFNVMDSLLDDECFALRPTVAEINLAALKHNIECIKSLAGAARIMGVVKANAYGHGLIRVARELLDCGVHQLGVAFLEEGIVLRRAGITAPILVLGGIIGNQISYFIENDLMITASSVFKLKQIEETAAALGKRAKIHLKIDTGMERIGAHYYNADQIFAAAVAARHCELCGVFSHFAASHAADGSFTALQLERFLEALEFFPRRSLPTPMRHIANSGAILQHPEAILDMVRPGIMMYGAYPAEETKRTVPLQPVLSLKTRVVYFKVVPEGSPVGYDGTWVAPCDTRVVTLPVGYGDGYRRSLANQASVLIHGKRYPIVGNISMDQVMVNIGQDSAYNNDEVVLIGPQGNDCITCEEIARLADTTSYEILTGINTRVPRTYV